MWSMSDKTRCNCTTYTGRASQTLIQSSFLLLGRQVIISYGLLWTRNSIRSKTGQTKYACSAAFRGLLNFHQKLFRIARLQHIRNCPGAYKRFSFDHNTPRFELLLNEASASSFSWGAERTLSPLYYNEESYFSLFVQFQTRNDLAECRSRWYTWYKGK